MKFGLLSFGYDNFSDFARQLNENGFFTANLGDNTQTIAVRRLYREIGISDEDVVLVNRDSLSRYDGEEINLVMNGVFFSHSFPISSRVRPIFLGFCASEKVIAAHGDHIRGFAPIGCRDVATADLCRKYNIDAFVTGCVTLTLKRKSPMPSTGRTLVVYGAGAGALPSAVMKIMPPARLSSVEFIDHRAPVFEFPVSEQTCLDLERYEEALLRRYEQTAALVVTPLHHVAAPCLAMGIPVVICRQDVDSRFSFLSTITRVHTPGTFHEIDWNPRAVSVEEVGRAFVTRLRAAI